MTHGQPWKALPCPGDTVRSAKRFRWHCWDMEALFSVFNVGKNIYYDPSTLCSKPHPPGGPGMGSLCKGPTTKKGNFTFNGHPSPWGGMEWIEGVLTPPPNFFFVKRCKNHVSVIRQRFSASALPGNIAGNRAHFCTQFWLHPPQGSLLRLPGQFEVTPWAPSGENTGTVHVFWARNICTCIICNIDIQYTLYIIIYDLCEI